MVAIFKIVDAGLVCCELIKRSCEYSMDSI